MDCPIRNQYCVCQSTFHGWAVRPSARTPFVQYNAGQVVEKSAENRELNHDLANPSYGALRPADVVKNPSRRCPLGLCFAMPLFSSPLLGWIVEVTSFETVFFVVSGVVSTGWLLTFRLREPRHAILAETSALVIPEEE